MDLSGLNGLIDMYKDTSKQVSKHMNGLNEILGTLKSQIPDENMKDFQEAFDLNNQLKNSLKDEKNPNELIDKIHQTHTAIKNKYKDAR